MTTWADGRRQAGIQGYEDMTGAINHAADVECVFGAGD
jgi:hypothetical protein